jgi:hypothetical protein
MGAAAAKIDDGPNLLSISEIAKRLKLDRATVRSRLEDLGYEADPSSTAKNQLFPFDDEMEFAIKSAKDTISATKIRQLRADAQLKELKLAEARGELVPMGEVVEISQKLTNAIYKEFAIHQPKRLATRLAKCKTAPEVLKLMKADTEKFMTKLRGNFQEVI